MTLDPSGYDEVVHSFFDGTAARRPQDAVAVGGPPGGPPGGPAGGPAGGPPAEPEDDPHRLAFVVTGNLPGMAGIWVVQYADRLAQRAGPVALLTSDGVTYSGQVLRGEGRAMPAAEGGWLAHASMFARRWLIGVREGTRLEEMATVRDATVVLLTGADETATAAARQKLRSLAGAFRAAGIAARPISLVVCGSPRPEALRLRSDLAVFAEDELGLHIESGGMVRQVDLVETTGPIPLPRASAAGVVPLARRILEDRLLEDVAGGPKNHESDPLDGPIRSSAEPRDVGESPIADAPGAIPSPAMPAPSSTPPPEPAPRRPAFDEAAAAPGPRLRGAAPPAPHAGSRGPAFHEGPLPSLTALFDDLVLLAPRVPDALGVELAADLGGRLHLISADPTTLDLRIARAWVLRNWDLLTRATTELTSGSTPSVVEHLILNDATQGARLQGCGLRLHARADVPHGVVRVDLNVDEGPRAR